MQVLPLPLGNFTEKNGIRFQNIIDWYRDTNKFKKNCRPRKQLSKMGPWFRREMQKLCSRQTIKEDCLRDACVDGRVMELKEMVREKVERIRLTQCNRVQLRTLVNKLMNL